VALANPGGQTLRDRVTAGRTFLHLSLRPVSERDVVPSSTGPWAVFGWAMITLGAAVAVLMIVFMIVFFGEPGAGA